MTHHCDDRCTPAVDHHHVDEVGLDGDRTAQLRSVLDSSESERAFLPTRQAKLLALFDAAEDTGANLSLFEDLTIAQGALDALRLWAVTRGHEVVALPMASDPEARHYQCHELRLRRDCQVFNVFVPVPR